MKNKRDEDLVSEFAAAMTGINKKHKAAGKRDKSYYREATRRSRQRRVEEQTNLINSTNNLLKEQEMFKVKITALQRIIESVARQKHVVPTMLIEENRQLRREIEKQKQFNNNLKHFFEEVNHQTQKLDKTLFLMNEKSKSHYDFVAFIDSSTMDPLWKRVNVPAYRVPYGPFKGALMHTRFSFLSLGDETVYRLDMDDLLFDFEGNDRLKRFMDSLDFSPEFFQGVRRYYKDKELQRRSETLMQEDNSSLVRWKAADEDDGVLQHISKSQQLLPSKTIPDEAQDSKFSAPLHVVSHLVSSFSTFQPTYSYAYFYRRNAKNRTRITMLKRMKGRPQENSIEMEKIRAFGYEEYSDEAFAQGVCHGNCLLATEMLTFVANNPSFR